MKDRRLRKEGYCDASVFPGPPFFRDGKWITMGSAFPKPPVYVKIEPLSGYPVWYPGGAYANSMVSRSYDQDEADDRKSPKGSGCRS